VSTNIRVAVLVGYELRRSSPHPGLSPEASIARIQRGYWHALDDNWEGVAEALGSDPGPAVLPEPDPAWPNLNDPTIPIDLTVARLYAQVIANMKANGYSAEQVACVEMEYAHCVPSSSASAPAAWVGLWEAVRISEKPPMDPANTTCDEPSTAAIICEVCPD
jgi:hypothetical protein